jgi:hypothetical protein
MTKSTKVFHTSEPWLIQHEFDHDSTYIVAAHDIEIACLPASMPWQKRLANARRIVACVHACKGITTEALENNAIKELIDVAHFALEWLTQIPPDTRKAIDNVIEFNCPIEDLKNALDKIKTYSR